MEPEGMKNKGKEEMAQQEEPLYDFPEPTQPSGRKPSGHHRGRGSLRSISVLDRLLLTVPVWFQLSINPATALHILQREPPGTFLVRKSRTSQRNVLCVRLADDSVPSFVQQFGIREAQSSKTLSLETSAISFPDLPRLVSFYCVSRDVLPFPLELPEAIAKATSHKELESISHMGIEFWNSHLNVRGPREAPRPQTDEKPDTAPPVAPPQTGATPQPDSAPQGDSGDRSDTTPQQSGPGSTLFHEFCPIRTRSPRELDCGSGQGALCFINPLFLQFESPLSRRRMFKRSLKVRVSTESSTLLSPPLAPPPPPPLMPKAKGKCKTLKDAQQPSQATHIVKDSQAMTQKQDDPSEDPGNPHIQVEQKQSPTQASAQLPAEEGPDNSDYMQPSPMITSSNPMVRPHFPKAPPSISPQSPRDSPLLSPYLSPSLSPKIPLSQSPYNSPTTLSSLSPYQFPSLSPFTPLPFPSCTDKQRSGREDEEDDAGVDRKDGNYEITEEEEDGLILRMNTTSLSDTDSCNSYSSLEGAADTPS